MVGELVGTLGHEDDKFAQRLIRILSRSHGGRAFDEALSAFEASKRPARARLISLMAEILKWELQKGVPQDQSDKALLSEDWSHQEISEKNVIRFAKLLLKAHGDEDLKTKVCSLSQAEIWFLLTKRRFSSEKIHEEEWAKSLITAWKQWQTDAKSPRPELWRVLIRALGQSASLNAQMLLENEAWQVRLAKGPLEPQALSYDEKLLERTLVILRRDVSRSLPDISKVKFTHGSTKEIQKLCPPLWQVLLNCRSGLEPFLERELHFLGAQDSITQVNSQDGRIYCLELGDFWTQDWTQKVSKGLRTAESLAFWWPIYKASDLTAKDLEDPACLWERALRPELVNQKNLSFLRVLGASTPLRSRFRLEMPSVPREKLWTTFKRLQDLVAPLGWVNDPKGAPWIFVWGEFQGSWGFKIVPKSLLQGRFSYRRDDVPASTHLPLGRALAMLADHKEDDLIWDPFCGAGTELLECSLRGPWLEAWGTDHAEEALLKARQNALRLSVTQEKEPYIQWGHLSVEKALEHFETIGFYPSLTITNPPYGKRVCRGHIEHLYQNVFVRVLDFLPHHARLVWVTPFKQKTDPLLLKAGFDIEFSAAVDLGGFTGHMQKAVKKIP